MNETGLVVSTMSYFTAATLLLGVSGLAGTTLIYPAKNADPSHTDRQSFGAAVIECAITILIGFLVGGDCSQTTTSSAFFKIEEAVEFSVNFLKFFFQLLTFSLPIPFVINAIIVLPGASGLAYVGIRLMRGGG